MLPAVALVALLLAPTGIAGGDPPTPPEGVQGEMQHDGTYLLSWQPPSSGAVDGYRVYENGELLAEVTDLSHEVAEDALAAVYTVTAFNEYGESQHSNPVIRTPFAQDPACMLLFPLPPYVQPSACVDLVEEVVMWILTAVCSGPPCPTEKLFRVEPPMNMDP